jgi:hypothetical protein
MSGNDLYVHFADDEIGETLYLYDSNTSGWNTEPSAGVMKISRVWVDNAEQGGARLYSQTTLGYGDGYGNQTSVTTYSGYATRSSHSGAQTSTTACTPAATYPITITNPLVRRGDG